MDIAVKRWMPFSMLISAAILSSVYFLLTGRTNEYRPDTNDPAVIYLEACAECHGEQGEGQGLFYPKLGKKKIGRTDVIEIIREGAFLMPAFPQISDTALKNLSAYIMEKHFSEKKQSEN
jgi:mono/diheme cytochrome c family protein